MSLTIALAGKGGTGKTTVAAMTVGRLLELGRRPVLAVDADPNTNLAEAVGFPSVERDVISSEILAEIKNQPAGTKELYMESRIHSMLAEGEGIDLLVMGRPEGSGCYCYVNSLLKKYVELLAGSYDSIVIDNEAGMEHLSRRNAEAIDLMLVVSDPTRKGLKAARRIIDLAEDLKLRVARTALIINRVADGVSGEEARLMAEDLDMEVAALLPADDAVRQADLAGQPVWRLENSVMRQALATALDGLLP